MRERRVSEIEAFRVISRRVRARCRPHISLEEDVEYLSSRSVPAVEAA
jgi:hypothetical protein